MVRASGPVLIPCRSFPAIPVQASQSESTPFARRSAGCHEMLLFAASCAALNLLMGFTGRSTRTRAPAMKQLTFFTGAHLSLCLHAHELASHPKQEYGFTQPQGSLQVLSSVAFAPYYKRYQRQQIHGCDPQRHTTHSKARGGADVKSVRCDLRWRWGCNTS